MEAPVLCSRMHRQPGHHLRLEGDDGVPYSRPVVGMMISLCPAGCGLDYLFAPLVLDAEFYGIDMQEGRLVYQALQRGAHGV